MSSLQLEQALDIKSSLYRISSMPGYNGDKVRVRCAIYDDVIIAQPFAIPTSRAQEDVVLILIQILNTKFLHLLVIEITFVPLIVLSA